ncbi:MAG: hypothetical protein AAF822_15235 [Pseudomonadota bacterium]
MQLKAPIRQVRQYDWLPPNWSPNNGDIIGMAGAVQHFTNQRVLLPTDFPKRHLPPLP